MIKVDKNDFKIKIHNGWLITTEAADKECFPGMFVFYSKNGEYYSWDDLVTVIEQDASNDRIQVDLYKKDYEECYYTFDYESGELRE